MGDTNEIKSIQLLRFNHPANAWEVIGEAERVHGLCDYTVIVANMEACVSQEQLVIKVELSVLEISPRTTESFDYNAGEYCEDGESGSWSILADIGGKKLLIIMFGVGCLSMFCLMTTFYSFLLCIMRIRVFTLQWVSIKPKMKNLQENDIQKGDESRHLQRQPNNYDYFEDNNDDDIWVAESVLDGSRETTETGVHYVNTGHTLRPDSS